MSNISISKKAKNYRELRPYLKLVDKINKLENQFEAYTDEQLKAKTAEFKNRLKNGETIHDLTVEAFATVREVSKRVLGLRHFDVQLLGGLVLLKNNISEMKTGEGKTLVASLPSYLVALEGKGVHIITVNDYLAKRDKELIGQIHEFLGLNVGLNIHGISNIEKKEAYLSDITYGVGTEFGFDLLRDNMVQSIDQKVQRPYHYAIIDEVDSILIDEAKTPLIIAEKDQVSSRLYKVCASVIKTLKVNEDFTFDLELKAVNFKDEGIDKCENVFGVNNLFSLEHSSLLHALSQALKARVLFQRDVDYIVEDGEVKLIDMNTGRIMEGRSLSDGLHQAIESKEGLVNTDENKTIASVTIQNYFRMYPNLSGMTGTARTEKDELLDVYGMEVIQVPSNKPNGRIDLTDVIFKEKDDKFAHLVKEVKERHQKGQPILIGTTSIQQSEIITELLEKEKLEFMVLNAKSVEKEAQLISLAGQRDNITIATNIAGRGTDIILGEGVDELGGLHVIGTERNESRRIDNQLVGRSGRQGDAGSTQFILSLEDYLFRRFAADELERFLPKVTTDKNGQITNKDVHKFVETAQKISEGIHYQFREFNLKLESVINSQREVLYEFRDAILEAENPLNFLIKQTENFPSEVIDSFFNTEIAPEEIDLEKFEQELNKILLPNVILDDQSFETVDEAKDFIQPTLEAHFEQLKSYQEDETIVSVSKGISLNIVDKLWKSHLNTMTQLKEGIGLRQYQQQDPATIFEKEGFTLFESSFNEILYTIMLRVNQYIIRIEKERQAARNK